MQTQPDKQDQTGLTDTAQVAAPLPLKSLNNLSIQRQPGKQKRVLLTYDGELAEPLPVEPLTEDSSRPVQSSLERLGKLFVQVLMLTVWTAIGVLLLHFFPGTPFFTFVVVHFALAVTGLFIGYGLVFLYDYLSNPYRYNYDETVQALYWDAVWSLCKFALSTLWSLCKFTLIVLYKFTLIALSLIDSMVGYSDDRDHHDWDYRRY